MAEQCLDDADIDAVLEQMGGEAVAQRMRSDALVDVGMGVGMIPVGIGTLPVSLQKEG